MGLSLSAAGPADVILQITAGLRASAARSKQGVPTNLCDWGARFFPQYFTNKSSAMHHALGEHLVALHGTRGVRYLKVSPRGSGKSVYLSFLDPLYAICEAREAYILILCDTYSQAVKHLNGIRSELEHNEALAAVYPEACGIGPEWTDSGIVTRNGIRVEPLGTGQKIRGRREGAARPTQIIIDDPQGDDVAYSKIQREHDWEWLTRGVFKAGGPLTNISLGGTNIHHDSIVGQLARSPGWKVEVDRSIMTWPVNMPLWTEWELVLCRMDDKNAAANAEKFYIEHKAAMDEGATVLWEDREPLVALMILRAIEGHAAFESEKQNNPIDPSKCDWTPDLFPDHRNAEDPLWYDVLPASARLCAVAMDPSKGSKDGRGDYCAIVTVWAANEAFYVDADMERRSMADCEKQFKAILATYKPDVSGIESVMFQELFIGKVVDFCMDKGLNPPVGLDNRVNKVVRIRRLDSYISHHLIRYKRGSTGMVRLIEQLQQFPNADNDDGPDAMEMAFRLMGYLINGQRGQEPA